MPKHTGDLGCIASSLPNLNLSGLRSRYRHGKLVRESCESYCFVWKVAQVVLVVVVVDSSPSTLATWSVDAVHVHH